MILPRRCDLADVNMEIVKVPQCARYILATPALNLHIRTHKKSAIGLCCTQAAIPSQLGNRSFESQDEVLLVASLSHPSTAS